MMVVKLNSTKAMTNGKYVEVKPSYPAVHNSYPESKLYVVRELMGEERRVGAQMLSYTSVSDAPFRRLYGGQFMVPKSSMIVSQMRHSTAVTVRQVEP
jgi:hypothetical protein